MRFDGRTSPVLRARARRITLNYDALRRIASNFTISTEFDEIRCDSTVAPHRYYARRISLNYGVLRRIASNFKISTEFDEIRCDSTVTPHWHVEHDFSSNRIKFLGDISSNSVESIELDEIQLRF